MRRLFLLCLVLLSSTTTAQTAPTVTLTATPTTGVSPLNVTLTWSSTDASSCSASGGWSGAKTTSGTQALTGVTATTTYTLTCAGNPGTATVSWAAPTLNTDGSPLTNLAGFKIYWANSSTGVASATPVVLNSPTTRSYAVTGLAAGTWYFGAKAFNSAGVDSDMSNLANKAITVASANASTTVTVTTKPMPPVVTVAQTAYEVRKFWFFSSLREIGTIDLGVSCIERAFVKKGAEYWTVPTDAVVVTGTPRTNVFVARCAVAG